MLDMLEDQGTDFRSDDEAPQQLLMGRKLHTSNSFAFLEHAADVELQLKLDERAKSTRSSPVAFLRVGTGRLSTATLTSLQHFLEFKCCLDRKLQKDTRLIDFECPRTTVIDAKDIHLLNKLGKSKVGRPINYNKKLFAFLSQAKSSLQQHD